MAQRLKPEVREALVEAATRVFAARGYDAATMAQIATEAGVSTGNVYRYFEGKQQLFEAVIPDELPGEFMSMVRARVATLSVQRGVSVLDEAARKRADELLEFWLRHRLRLVVLLDRAAGSPHEGFGEQFVDELVRLSIARLKADDPRIRITRLVRFSLDNAARNSRRSIVAILETFDSVPQLRAAVAGFWSFQLAGLEGLTKWIKER